MVLKRSNSSIFVSTFRSADPAPSICRSILVVDLKHSSRRALSSPRGPFFYTASNISLNSIELYHLHPIGALGAIKRCII